MKKSKIIAVLMGMFVALSSAFAGDWDITVFRPAVNPRDKKDVMVRAAAKYTEATGGKVQFIIGDWGGWQSKVLTRMAAGDPIDVVFARDGDFPKFVIKGYLQPLENYVNLKGLKSADGKKSIISMKNEDGVFKYDGHYYAASHITSNHMWIVLYNKSLMEEEGIKESEQPYALWKAGKWDWDHLEKLALKLTKDTAGTGSIDRWGLGNWYTQAFIYANGGKFTLSDARGNQTLNFNDPKVVEALTFLEKAKKEGWYQQDSSIAKDGLQNRTIAMYMEREYYASQVVTKTNDEIAYVPLPIGPSAKGDQNVFECDGYGIGNGSKHQKAAGKFIEFALQEWYADDMKNRSTTWPQEVLDLADTMLDEGGYYPGPSVSALDQDFMSGFLGEVIWTGNSPAAAIEKYTPKAQALLADANKPMGKFERLPFKGISQDFEKISDKTIGTTFTPWSETKTAKITIVSGAQAIDGKKSLKLEFTPKDDKETGAVLALSNPDKMGIVGWKNYKVSFKVKISGKMTGKKATVWVKGYGDTLNQYGYISKQMDDATKVYEVSGFINDVLQNGKLGIQLGIDGCNAVVIDDFVVTEK